MTELAEPATRDETFPLARTCPFSPPPAYEELREAGPVQRVGLPDGSAAWAITRLEEVRQMLTDPRFSSDRFNPGFPILTKDGRPQRRRFTASLINMDPPEHGAARREVVGEFTVKRMKALQPRIQQIVDEHIDAMLAGPKPADLVSALSLPVPSLVICEQLGVPYADHDFFQSRSSTLLNREVTQEVRVQAVEELQNYLDGLVAAKEADPTDDLLGRQVLKQREEHGDADHDSLVSLAFLLLLAGHETTANMISLGTLALLENPDQLEIIKNDPGKTLDAVEELLRYFTIAEFATSRVATEDVEIGGQLIRAGEGVLGLSYSGNRDAAAFENPDELDIERGARHHVAFGFGPHQCLGQNLARMELQIVFDTLFRRIPELKLAAPVDQLPFKHDSSIFGLYCLPVTW
ncbi:Cytochrome P450 [Amycolatopsis tolypomycina]|uniref:Cytochrome P450 n=1 Tax=Amycolatopsis tolypomycina TaxID=208445 RepID=A0A1H4IIS3_9PSEU|nr:cytochrome P450 [Amycolatopsis tolypomycina]SEB33981.1 Cytochrome P450 [Amycolatopsis tolypomycina]